MELFLEDWILNTLCPKKLSSFFTTERAHRALAPTPRPGAPPHAIIARLFNFRDQDAILQRARAHGAPKFKGQAIMIFPDFTRKVQESRRTSGQPKKS